MVKCTKGGVPHRAYARAFAALLAKESEKQACRTMVGLLALAHDRACEAELAEAIDADLDGGALPNLGRLRQRFTPDQAVIPDPSSTVCGWGRNLSH